VADNDERTEQATPRRRQKAREQGQFARSRDLTSMAAMAGTLIAFSLAGSMILDRMLSLTAGFLRFRTAADPIDAVRYVSVETMRMMAPFLIGAAALSLAAATAQSGFLMKPVSMDLLRLNPLTGLKRIFSFEGLGETLKSLAKFAVGGTVFYLVIRKAVAVLPMIAALDLRELMAVSARLIGSAVMTIFIVFLVAAAADYLYERWKFERSIRMTREEIREEFRESEGDPQIKARVKSIQRDLARRRMMQEVPKATVVITNPTHLAVALLYNKETTAAPKIVAKGAGHVAEAIRQVARRNSVPIVEDKPLARALFKRDIGSSIPRELYQAVAKVLAYIYKLRGAASMAAPGRTAAGASYGAVPRDDARPYEGTAR
jgi:flagellar biosynthetic protein FlhB